MPHKFDVKRANVLEDINRIRSINPSLVFKLAGIRKGMKVADVGCGTGVFSIMLSELVGLRGAVYAIDIKNDMLKILVKKISEKKIINVKPTLSTEDHIPLPDKSIDRALMINTLHELDGKLTLMEIHRILRNDGTFTIVDWKKIKTKTGPPLSERIPTSRAVKILKETGFKTIQTSETGSEHYLISTQKCVS